MRSGSTGRFLKAFVEGLLHGIAAPLLLFYPSLLASRQAKTTPLPRLPLSDAEALASDWQQVGQDMWHALKCYEQETPNR